VRILVLGGSGFIGEHVVAKLVAGGHSVVIPTRSRERSKALLPLPTADVVEADIHESAVLDRLVAGADAVVNLVGILNASRRESFQRVHADLPADVVRACRQSGVRRILHMSALGASPDAPSAYLRSKAAGEAAVRDAGLDATTFAPSVVFGQGDGFLTMLARLMSKLPIVVLAAPEARFQPVWVRDVAECFVRALHDNATIGRRYELGGPRVYTLRELVDWVGETTGHVRPVLTLGPSLSRVQAAVLERLPGRLLTRDNLASMSVASVTSAPFPFGIVPASLEAVAPDYLAPASIHSRYESFRAQSGR
jgi:uncharacterized protein YbjT (DUF2867 family)